MTNFIVKEKLISGKCVERVTIPKKNCDGTSQSQMVVGVMILDLPNVQIINSKVDGRIVKVMDGVTSNTEKIKYVPTKSGQVKLNVLQLTEL